LREAKTLARDVGLLLISAWDTSYRVAKAGKKRYHPDSCENSQIANN
jgi:hypothetical protein